MQLVMTGEEVKKAITLYLKANAAVDINNIDFIAKRSGGGIVAEVDATIHSLNLPEIETVEVEPLEPVQEEVIYESDNVKVHSPEEVEQHTQEPSELETRVVDAFNASPVEHDGIPFDLDESPIGEADNVMNMDLDEADAEPVTKELPESLSELFD